MKYTVIWENNVSIMDKRTLEYFLSCRGITETSGGSEKLRVPGWTRYEGNNGFVCLVHEGNVNEHKKQYKVIHGFDTDGGFGDADYHEDVLAICPTKEDAEMIVKAYAKPHAYYKPYDYLYCGQLEVEEEETQTFAEFVMNHHPSDCWWLTNDVIEVDENEDEE